MRIKDSIWRRMRKLAIDEGCTASDLMERAAEQYLRKQEEEPTK
jgi:hypothetical protein